MTGGVPGAAPCPQVTPAHEEPSLCSCRQVDRSGDLERTERDVERTLVPAVHRAGTRDPSSLPGWWPLLFGRSFINGKPAALREGWACRSVWSKTEHVQGAPG